MKKIFLNPSIELTIVKNNVIATSSVFEEVGSGEILKSEDLFFDFESDVELL